MDVSPPTARLQRAASRATIVGALQNAGFLVERVVEPVPDDAYIAAFPQGGSVA
jgi:hypothetical protein